LTVELITKIEKWDYKVFLSLYKRDILKRSYIRRIAQIYSFFGNMYFWGLIWLFLAVYGYITKEYYLFALITGGFIQSVILHVFIRYKLVNRNRPFITLEAKGVEQHDDLIRENKSFPSGHVTFFLFFGCIFAFYYIDYFWEILSIFLILDIFMAITRLILGVHFPTDVIFGFIFGIVFALLYYLTYIYWIMFFYLLGQIFLPILQFLGFI
jgi:undecaprenyl-diphosphatase